MASPRRARLPHEEEYEVPPFITRDEWARFLVREYDPMAKRVEEGIKALNNKLWGLILAIGVAVIVEVVKLVGGK